MNSKDIQNEMERQRVILHQLADEFGFLDERVLVQSQKLDEWLNEYERDKNS
ncbi:aspartyl-phosphate phosphatase Spo0E family protein [Saccharibacillus sacchari]|uniref:Aspartyl-phosphate phosphatase Spo0E family protein n=1 Tax=Saccharibacillus sacchari TaxID=456493 RepID=A0ACC6PGV3_9BACL